jgi:HK97 family phage portal protein
MNAITRLLTRARARVSSQPEQRQLGSPTFGDFGLGPITAGSYVNARVAENLSTVVACVGAIASALSTLPAFVYRSVPGGREEASNHPVARLIRAPNDRQTWPDWLEMMIAQVLLYGNAISVIEYDGAGRPTRLLPVPWNNVQVFLLPSGELAYDIVQFIAPWGGTGTPRRYLNGEVVHIKDRSDDGFLGRSRLSRAPEVLGNALSLQEFSSAQWKNGVTPSGAIQMEGSMTPEQFNRVREQMSTIYAGAHNARKVLILDNRATWQALSVSPEDAEVLASRRFTVEELCRLYQVPPPIIQDYTHGTFTNASQAALWFAQLTLTPWAKKIEAEFARSVFGDDSAYHLEIDLAGLMRGDYAARWAAYAIAVQNKILDPDEIREAEGYNPRGVKGAPLDPVAA